MARILVCDNCEQQVDQLFYESVRWAPVGNPKGGRTFVRSTHREVCEKCILSWIEEPRRGYKPKDERPLKVHHSA